MALDKTPRGFTWLAAVVALLCIVMISPAKAQLAEVTVWVGDTIAYPNTTNNIVSVFMDNPFDTIVGFNLWIKLDRPPDIMIFQTDSATQVDTTYWACQTWAGPVCIDSLNVDPDSSSWDFIHIDTFEVEVGSFDTTGTLIAGWEYVDAKSESGNSTDLIIVGIADLPGGGITRGIPPHQGGTVQLIKLLADVLDIPDSSTDRTVLLPINRDFKDNLNIVTTDPNWSIWTYVLFEDTNCWQCTLWAIDTTVNPPDTIGCLSYERASCLLFQDSIEIIPDSFAVLDTNRIKLYDGTLVVQQGVPCGDLNGDGDIANIVDLTFFIDYVFRGGPAPDPLCRGDFNCDTDCANIVDLTYQVDFIFRGGPPVCIGC